MTDSTRMLTSLIQLRGSLQATSLPLDIPGSAEQRTRHNVVEQRPGRARDQRQQQDQRNGAPADQPPGKSAPSAVGVVGHG